MKVLTAEFIRSGRGPSDGAGWPPEGPPEIAFAGRSNVGKSTILQALAQRHGLVRISGTPGRTRLINFFRVVVAGVSGEPVELGLVDLPGYGYAKVAKSEREAWLPFVDEYLARRQSLRVLVLLVDARRDAGLDETEIVRYVAERGVVVQPVLTKLDKLAKHERRPVLDRLKRALAGSGARPPIGVSGQSREGIDELWRRLAGMIGIGGSGATGSQ